MLNLIKILILAVMFIANTSLAAEPFVEIDSSSEQFAWFLRASYNPTGKTIRGINISLIDKRWCAANEFSTTLLPKDIAEEVSTVFREDGYSFSLTGFSPENHKNLTAITGIAKFCEANTAVFVLILDPKKEGINRIVFVDSFLGEQFAMLKLWNPKELQVNWCYGCDSGQSLVSENGKFIWKYSEPYDNY